MMENDDKWFLGIMSVAIVILSMLFGVLILMALFAMFQAMTMKIFVIWVAIISFIAWASRKLYLAAIKNNWIEKF